MKRKKGRLGATGAYPRGKLRGGDEGELRLSVGVKDRTVILDFGKDVAWIGMGAQDAANLGSMLIKHARECARETGTPITVVI